MGRLGQLDSHSGVQYSTVKNKHVLKITCGTEACYNKKNSCGPSLHNYIGQCIMHACPLQRTGPTFTDVMALMVMGIIAMPLHIYSARQQNTTNFFRGLFSLE